MALDSIIRRLGLAAVLAYGAAGLVAASAQTTVAPPRPVETQPLPPLPGATVAPALPAAPPVPVPAVPPAPPATAATPAPPALPPVAQTPPPAPPPAAAVPPLPVPPGTVPPAPPAAVAGQETLAPPPVDSSTPDTVELAARPAATLRGQSTWEEGYDRLTQSFQRLQSEMDKAGVRVTGKPLATFLETDDTGFRFQALLPVATPPATRPPGLPADIAFGSTPAGKAIRFVHKAPYDDIDSTYEAVSAYLDTKGIEVKDNFTEEYVAIGSGPGDTGLELYIYVQPK